MGELFFQNKELANNLLKYTCTKFNFNYDELIERLKTENIQKIIIQYVFTIDKTPEEHAILAGAISMWKLYNNCPLTIREYANMYKIRLRPEVYNFMIKHADILQKHIIFTRDFEITYFQSTMFLGMYLSTLKKSRTPFEIPQFFWMRIAIGQYYNSDTDDITNVLEAYDAYSTFQVVPASPTMFNMGFNTGSTASCMLYTIADEMDDILNIYKECGIATKNNAGLGICFSYLRHSQIGYEGMSQGVIPLAVIMDRTLKYIDQGGKRPGAMCGTLIIHHYDIPEFIQLKDQVNEDECKAKNMNTCVFLTDLFWERFHEDGIWTLFCPHETPELNRKFGPEYKRIYLEYEAKAEIWSRYLKYVSLSDIVSVVDDPSGILDANQLTMYNTLMKEFGNKPIPEKVSCRKFKASVLMEMITTMQAKTSHPFIGHWDNTQRKNNMENVGVVDSFNLCQEITIPRKLKEETGCCILSSLCIGRFVNSSREFNWTKFSKSVRFCVISLNKVIDKLDHVSDKVLRSNNNSRPIGIGVMGFANALYKMDIPFVDTSILEQYADGVLPSNFYFDDELKKRKVNPKLMEFNKKLWSCMYYNALKESCAEAKRYGPYPLFWSSPTAKGKLQYHLWQEEESLLNRKYPFSLTPCEPSEWGQDGTWELLIADIKQYGLRNALLLSCQPTASSSNIANATEMTEPYMYNMFVRKVMTGDFISINYDMVNDFKEIGLWNPTIIENIRMSKGSLLQIPEGPTFQESENGLTRSQIKRLRFLKEKYLTLFEMPQKILVQLAAQRQVFIDQTQSFNINIAEPTHKKLLTMHKMTHEYGLKTGMYYLRTRPTEDPLAIGHREENSILEQVKNQLNLKKKKTNTKKIINEILDVDIQKISEVINAIETKEVDIQNKIIKDTIATKIVEGEICTMKEGCISCQ